jgi:ribosomal protein S18 acetylase RimI-like enzyme
MTSLRRATPSDAATMHAIAQAAYAGYVPRMGRRPYPMDMDYDAAVADAESWVAVDDSSVVGFLVLVDEADAVLLENVGVLPSHHGRGVGRALLELAESRAVESGHSRIRLFTHVTMVENQALYERIGYVETRRGGDEGFVRVFYEKVL